MSSLRAKRNNPGATHAVFPRPLDCRVAALLAMTVVVAICVQNIRFCSRGALRPSDALKTTLTNKEGAGNAGCALHP